MLSFLLTPYKDKCYNFYLDLVMLGGFDFDNITDKNPHIFTCVARGWFDIARKSGFEVESEYFNKACSAPAGYFSNGYKR